jgi:N-acetylmuramic acid 6-phosphate (MurNAc-6-P) etherase
MYKEKIVDVETGQITLRDYTAEEVAKVESAQAEAAKKLLESQIKDAARTAILTKLGLTAEEAQALLG